MGSDLRLAVRRLRQQPGFTVVAVFTLALGLGVNTAIFTIANALANQELPVRTPSELYRLGDDGNCCVNSGLQDNYSLFSTRLYHHLRDTTPEFSSMAGFQANTTTTSVRRSGSEITESVPAQFVSANYFDTLGVSAAAGRLLEASDDAPGAPPVFVMSHRTWRLRFGGDPSVVGATFLVAGYPATLVGIADERFFGETVRPNPAGLWIPLGKEPETRGASSLLDRTASDWLYIIGRLAPGATPAQVEARATANLQRWLSDQPWVEPEARATLGSRRIKVVSAAGGVRTLRLTFERPVLILFGMSALVLLIAAANLANLLLARADRGQAAVRVALGASPARLVRQSLAEGAVLALVGGALGLAVAAMATRAIVALAFAGVEFLPIDLAPSATVLAFSFAIAVVTGMIFSSAPAWAMSRTNPIDALRGTGRGGAARGFMPRRTLVVVQVALSMVLLVGAGLLSESLRRLESQRLGFDPEGRMAVFMNPPQLQLPPEQLGELYGRVLANVERIPGVARASYALSTPMDGNNWSSTIAIAGAAAGESLNASWNRVGPDYFDIVGTRVLRGRAFDERDLRPESRAAIVNDAFVRRFLAGTDPLGRRLGFGGASHASDLEIVGVVDDVKHTNVARPVRPMIFLPGMQTIPYTEAGLRSVQMRSQQVRALVLQTDGASDDLYRQLREALARVHADFSVTRVVTLEEQVSLNFRVNRLLARLTAGYGLLALALAVLGVYGVTAYGVAMRTREIGVRMALGADRARVVRGIVGGAIVQAAAGIVIGGAAALYAVTVVGTFLYEIDARDPVVIATSLVVIALSAAAAASGPAWRASRISPAQALRAE